MQTTDTGTVIVGAGQAGLCAAHYREGRVRLRNAGEADAVGTSWSKQRWDSFRLVTENSLCMMRISHARDWGTSRRFYARDTITAYLGGVLHSE